MRPGFIRHLCLAPKAKPSIYSKDVPEILMPNLKACVPVAAYSRTLAAEPQTKNKGTMKTMPLILTRLRCLSCAVRSAQLVIVLCYICARLGDISGKECISGTSPRPA